MEVTKDFQTFVDGMWTTEKDYNEVYELHQAATGDEESLNIFERKPANGGGDMLIIHKPSDNALRLTPKAAEYFPEWIEQQLMDGMDAESYWGMHHAMEKDD